jgi:hypothetical protein
MGSLVSERRLELPPGSTRLGPQLDLRRIIPTTPAWYQKVKRHNGFSRSLLNPIPPSIGLSQPVGLQSGRNPTIPGLASLHLARQDGFSNGHVRSIHIDRALQTITSISGLLSATHDLTCAS